MSKTARITSACLAALLLMAAAVTQIDYSQIKNAPSIPPKPFSQTLGPSQTLSAGVPATVNMRPCPVGVNGADSGHSIYVSGGTGTAEAVTITGGTCTSGASSGTLQFTPANSHTGAWTLSSATGGVQEAMVSLGATSSTFSGYGTGGGVVQIPCGVISSYGPITVPSNVQLHGSGECTTIRAMVAGLNVITTAPASYRIVVSDLTVDINGKANTIALDLNSTSLGRWSFLKVVGGAGLTTGVGMRLRATNGSGNTAFNQIDNLTVDIGPAEALQITGYAHPAGPVSTENSFWHLRLTNGVVTSPVVDAICCSDSNKFYFLDISSGASYGIVMNSGNPTADNGIGGYRIYDLTCEAITTNCVQLNWTNENAFFGVRSYAPQTFGYISQTPASNYFYGIVNGPAYAGTAPMQIGDVNAGAQLATPHTDKILANGANQDITIANASYIRITGPTGGFSLGGFTAPAVDGTILRVYNTTSQVMTISNQAAGSTAANRIITLTGADVVLRAGQSAATFIYSAADSRWTLMGTN